MSLQSRFPCRASLFSLVVASLWGALWLAGSSPQAGAAQEVAGDKKASGDKDGKTTTAKALTADEKFVKENIEKYLSPTKIEWKKDGKLNVRMVFNFGEKKEEHEEIFTPRISNRKTSVFRWALDGEYTMGSWGRREDDEVSSFVTEGIRISNAGAAHLNVWFKDDVEAEISYSQCVSSSAKQMVAVVFTNKRGNSLGSNFGSQCALFRRGRLVTAKGKKFLVSNEKETRMKLLVKDGKFFAYRDKRKRCEAPYKQKTFASGRVGIIWGGGVASFVHRFEVTGTIDAKLMAKEMHKKMKK